LLVKNNNISDLVHMYFFFSLNSYAINWLVVSHRFNSLIPNVTFIDFFPIKRETINCKYSMIISFFIINIILSFVKKLNKSNFDINNLQIIFKKLLRKSYKSRMKKKIQVENHSAC